MSHHLFLISESETEREATETQEQKHQRVPRHEQHNGRGDAQGKLAHPLPQVLGRLSLHVHHGQPPEPDVMLALHASKLDVMAGATFATRIGAVVMVFLAALNMEPSMEGPPMPKKTHIALCKFFKIMVGKIRAVNTHTIYTTDVAEIAVKYGLRYEDAVSSYVYGGDDRR